LIVIGALVGTQTGREVEITNSFELAFEIVDGKVIVNVDYFTTKQDQCMSLPIFSFLCFFFKKKKKKKKGLNNSYDNIII
jgi:COP9 signalosome complex subunit 6